MKETLLVMQTILLSVPLCGALVCAMLLFKLAHNKRSPLEQKVLYLIVFYYFASAVLWMTTLFFLQSPERFVAINPILVLAALIVYVTYYHFIFFVTKTSRNEKFPLRHYLLLAIVFFAVLTWSLTTPFEEQLYSPQTPIEGIEGIKIFHLLFVPVPFLLLGYNLTYAVMSLFRAFRYRRVVVNYSADKERGTISWVYQLVVTMFLMSPLLACVLLLSGGARIIAMVLLALCSIFKYTILAHNILFENFVLINLNGNDTPTETDTKPANIRQLENYMRNHKPYLKPKLKITDIIGDLGTNRTSLSVMINRYYGMNFCRYVNQFRLEELEQLRADPANARLFEVDLVLMAGFSDWRGYQREMAQRNKSVKDKVIGMKDLKRGDILLYPPNDFVGRVILAVTKGSVSYSGIYYGDKNGKQYIAHVNKNAMMLTPFDEFMNAVKICYVRRLNVQSDLSPVLRSADIYLQGNNSYPYSNLILLALLMAVKKFSKNVLHSKKFYDFSLFVSLKMMKAFSKIRVILGKGENTMICSHYVAKCFSDAGKKYSIKFKPILYDYDDLHKSLKGTASAAEPDANKNYFVTPYDLFSNAENLLDIGIITNNKT